MGTVSSHPAGQPGAGPATERASAPPAVSGTVDEPIRLEPSDAEIDAWAERERHRRAGWVTGPTAEEREAWRQWERERRLARLTAAPASAPSGPVRRPQRYLREAQLAAEGAMSLVWKGVAAEGPVGFPLSRARRWSRRGLAVLVRAGREWEAEHDQPVRGRRVPFPEDGAAP